MVNLESMDLSLVPAGDLASLARCAGYQTHLDNVQADLAPLLSNVQCTVLSLCRLSLTTADTQALVAAMVTGVGMVELGGRGGGQGVTLDMETLAQYDGRGKCRQGYLWDLQI